jgi:hypothetical protein
LALQLSPQTHLQRILYWYLRQDPDQARRKGILAAALANTTGLFTPVMAINWLEARTKDKRPGDSDALLQNQADIDELRRQAVAKIEDAAKPAASQGRRSSGFCWPFGVCGATEKNCGNGSKALLRRDRTDYS